MAANRDATSYLKTAIVRKLRSEFDHTRVPGLTQIPLIIQDRPLNNTPYPYVYIDISDVEESDVTKDGSAYTYVATIEVCNRTTQQEDGKRLRDGITDEIVNTLDVSDTSEYLDLSNDGFSVYIQTVTSPSPIPSVNAYGSTYWKTEIDVLFRISFIGTPQERLPVQQAIYTFTGFNRPVNTTIELWDTGTITGATSYPSANNGWDFVPPPVYQLGIGSGGTLNNNVITVGDSRANIQVIAQLSYEFNTNTDNTTIITDTDNWGRRVSFRYGAIRGSSTQPTFVDSASGSLGLRNLEAWETSPRFFTSVTNPVGQAITIPQEVGDYLYFVVGSGVNITDVRPTSFASVPSANFIDQFDSSLVGDYRVYIRNRQSTVSGDFNITIVA